MDLENAIFGPGWAWSMISTILVVGSLVGLYRQLRMARSDSVREQLLGFTREWDSERLLRHRLAVLVAARDAPGRPDLPEGSAQAIGDFWEQIASLARAGHQDGESLLAVLGWTCQSYWQILSPWTMRLRAESGMSNMLRDFEWLADLAAEHDRRSGSPVITTEATAARVPVWISRVQDQIRVEQALRTTMIAAPETTPPGPVGTASDEDQQALHEHVAVQAAGTGAAG